VKIEGEEMECQDCNKLLDKSDLAAGICQGCTELLDNTQLQDLRQHLNIEGYKPPEITPPKREEAPIGLPESEECPSCNADLMESQLKDWRNGMECPWCQEPSIHIRQSSQSAISDEVGLEEIEQKTIPFIINNGPKVGTVIHIPYNKEIGRNDFRKLLNEPEYLELIKHISSEHLILHYDESTNSVSIEDLGSTNGTYIDGSKVVGPIAKDLTYGQVLNIYNLSFCLASLDSRTLQVRHMPSNIVLHYPITTQPLSLHFGRHDEQSGREPWYRMAQVQLDNDIESLERLETISRRHLFMEIECPLEEISLKIWHEQNKEPWAIEGLKDIDSTTHQKPQSSMILEHEAILLKHGSNEFCLTIKQ
jgi:Zn finger protein HypA/HybF involved in hydrogenase expression